MFKHFLAGMEAGIMDYSDMFYYMLGYLFVWVIIGLILINLYKAFFK